MHLQLPDNRTLSLDRPVIMGILNVTPDSFSDGGAHDAHDAAVAHGLQMADEGADIIDVGGESTRPGSQRVSAGEQKQRVIEVIRSLRTQLDAQGDHGKHVAISIDTTLSEVAAAALDAGAAILNDVSAGREDPRLLPLAASHSAPIILMHMQGAPATMQQNPAYEDVIAEVTDFLLERAIAVTQAGVPHAQIILDPGIGFGKSREHNLKLIATLDHFVKLGYAVMLGTSRKRFMGSVCVNADGTSPQPHELLGATCATTALGVAQGVKLFRVHDVKANRQAADVAFAIMQA
ncbi:MAG: dihydropteroate synthase [Phycisphaeraceae bacterium]